MQINIYIYVLTKNAPLIFLLVGFFLFLLVLFLFILLILRYRPLPPYDSLCSALCLILELLHEVAYCEVRVFNLLQPMRHEVHLLAYRVKSCKDFLNGMLVSGNKPHEGSLNVGNRDSHLLLCRFTERCRRVERNRYNDVRL